jgi:hypothetical protein
MSTDVIPVCYDVLQMKAEKHVNRSEKGERGLASRTALLTNNDNGPLTTDNPGTSPAFNAISR